MTCVAAAPEKRTTVGPAPAGFFLTPKLLDVVPSLRDSELHDRIRGLIETAEVELFQPLFASSRVADLSQNFETLANRYFPIRLQALLVIVNIVGLDRFRTEYFQNVPRFAATLAGHANNWGLPAVDVAGSFEQYFNSALKIIDVASYVPLASAANIYRVAGSLTLVDYGFTAMGLVFEGSIKTQSWCISQVFNLTRRSLLDYENATDALIAEIKATHPGQAEMFSATDAHANVGKVVQMRAANTSLREKAHERTSELDRGFAW